MKKALASLLAAGMAASLLAGCGGSSSTAASTADTSTAASTEASSTAESDAPLEGEITFWHSFTQGARMEAVQKAADKFMEANPGVKINIETYSWGDFNTKWNAGLTTGDRCATALRDASHSRGRPIAFAWRTASDLAITKTDGVTSVAAGGSLTYTITASNAGPDNATGAIVTDTLPASLTGATWTCVGAGGGTCTAAGSGNINDTVNLPAGASVTYTVVATVSAAATGTISNTATVTAPAGFIEAHPANNTATDTDTVTQSGDLGITLSGTAGSVPPGAAVNYTLVARNPGPSNATGVAVASTLAAQLQGLSWACVGSGGGTCTASGAGNVADTVNLPAGASVAYTYTLSGTVVPDATPGDATSTAALTPPAGFSDPSPTNNSASAITSIHASVAVPTLSEWATGLMAALMALGAACGLRRRDRQRG